MRYAVIEGGVVVNVVTAQSPEFATSQGWVIVPTGRPVTFNWTWDGSVFAPPVLEDTP